MVDVLGHGPCVAVIERWHVEVVPQVAIGTSVCVLRCLCRYLLFCLLRSGVEDVDRSSSGLCLTHDQTPTGDSLHPALLTLCRSAAYAMMQGHP
jgi:hypothetical protein